MEEVSKNINDNNTEEIKVLKVHELEVGKMYDIVGNEFPEHIYYFINEEGFLWYRDIIVHCNCEYCCEYNEVIKMRFIECNFISCK